MFRSQRSKTSKYTKEWPKKLEENQKNVVPQKRQKHSKKDEVVKNVKNSLEVAITSKSTVFSNKELLN